MVTEISDRESDIYEKWARLPEPGFHILTRAMVDRSIREGGGKLSSAPLQMAGTALIALRARLGRPARNAKLVARFGHVTLKRPAILARQEGLAETVKVSLVEVCEVNAPPGAKPIAWRLLTTHGVKDAAMAWRVVGWYRQRWHIEQFFRTLKQQGLQLEDSQLENAGRLIKLTAIAARAACTIMQLVQARDGRSGQDAKIAFSPPPKSRPSTHYCPRSKERPRSRRTLTRRKHLLGPRGSLPSSVDGMATQYPNRPAQSPSATGSNTSNPSPTDGGSEMCESPRLKMGGLPSCTCQVVLHPDLRCLYGVPASLLLAGRMSKPAGNLPDDPPVLEAMIAALQAENAQTSATLRIHDQLVQALRLRIAKLQKLAFWQILRKGRARD